MENLRNKRISIIIPVFNEEESLLALIEEINKVVQKIDTSFDFLFVNDGSTDSSLKILKKIKKQDERVKIISFKRNFGKATALSAGFREASGDLIITMDADLQDPPEEIPKLIDAIKNDLDLVSGWKKNRRDPFIKIISSKIFNTTTSKLFNLKLNDLNSGYKIYKKEVVKNIKVYGELHRFLPILAHEKGFSVGEIELKHAPRKFGKSKYGRWGLKRLKNYLLDPINVILLTRYSKKPIHFFGNLGLLFLTTGFFICLYLTFIWLSTENPIGNRPLLFLGVLLLIMGMQLLSFGLIGEMIIKNSNKNDYKIYRIIK